MSEIQFRDGNFDCSSSFVSKLNNLYRDTGTV